MIGLSFQDVTLLRSSPAANVREMVARKVCNEFSFSRLSSQEKNIAEDILRLIARDLESKVRRVISEVLSKHPELPRDVAFTLASDDYLEVSLPILEASSVLTEEDLLAIIRSTRQTAKYETIARREAISEPVCHALASTGCESAVQYMLNNRSAAVSEPIFESIVEDFRYREDVMRTLILRGQLPAKIFEKVVTGISSSLRQELIEKYKIPPTLATEAAKEGYNEAILQTVSQFPPGAESKTDELVQHLHQERKLAPMLVIRALCKADMEFFERAIAKLAGIPHANARKLIWDSGYKGFAALYHAAGLPEHFLEAASEVLACIKQEWREGNHSKAALTRKLLERIGTGEELEHISGMRYLLTLMRSGASLPQGNA